MKTLSVLLLVVVGAWAGQPVDQGTKSLSSNQIRTSVVPTIVAKQQQQSVVESPSNVVLHQEVPSSSVPVVAAVPTSNEPPVPVSQPQTVSQIPQSQPAVQPQTVFDQSPIGVSRGPIRDQQSPSQFPSHYAVYEQLLPVGVQRGPVTDQEPSSSSSQTGVHHHESTSPVVSHSGVSHHDQPSTQVHSSSVGHHQEQSVGQQHHGVSRGQVLRDPQPQPYGLVYQAPYYPYQQPFYGYPYYGPQVHSNRFVRVSYVPQVAPHHFQQQQILGVDAFGWPLVLQPVYYQQSSFPSNQRPRSEVPSTQEVYRPVVVPEVRPVDVVQPVSVNSGNRVAHGQSGSQVFPSTQNQQSTSSSSPSFQVGQTVEPKIGAQ